MTGVQPFENDSGPRQIIRPRPTSATSGAMWSGPGGRSSGGPGRCHRPRGNVGNCAAIDRKRRSL